MTALQFTEKNGYAVIRLPAFFEENDWLGFKDRIFRQFIDLGMVNLVLDCEDCHDLPSISYGAFTCLSRDLRRIKGSLHLVHVSEKIRQVIIRTRLGDYIPIRGTLTEVVHRTAAVPRDGDGSHSPETPAIPP